MGTMNRRYRTPDMGKLTLSAEALAVLPEVADFLEETGLDLRYKADRDGYAHAAATLRQEHVEPTGDYLARAAAGKTVGDLEEATRADDPAQRWQRILDSVEGRDPGVVLMTPSKRDALRALLAEVRDLRNRVPDPASTYLVTVKLPKNPEHNPRAKQIGPCLFSDSCTDVTGEHHTFLTNAAGLAALPNSGWHVTRVELLQKTPDFLRELEVQMQGRPPRRWASAEEIPVAVEQVKDGFGRVWTRQLLPLVDGSPQWRLAGDRFGRPLPADGFPVTEVD